MRVISCPSGGSLVSRSFFASSAQTQPKPSLMHDDSAWVALLDPYLPPSLRKEGGNLESGPSRKIQYVPLILKQARARYPHSLDLLCHLGLTQKRWKAVVWLAKDILRLHMDRLKAKAELDELRAPSWNVSGMMSLRDLTWREIWADNLLQPLEGRKLNLAELIEPSDLDGDGIKNGIGQIWQSLGNMILQAADCPAESPSANEIFSCIFEILAHMHHLGAIPSTIYTYAPPQDPFSLQRPPTLSYSSFRIMTILADTAWRSEDRNTQAKQITVSSENADEGHDLSEPGTEPQVRGLGIGIWLDLVLWSCIEDGLILEATWIVTEMDRRKDNKQLSWSVMRWESQNNPETLTSNWNMKLEQEIAKSRMNQIAGGIAIAGYGSESPAVHMPLRTISREVILALVDGLANISGATNSTGPNPLLVQQHINTCKRLLATEGFGLESCTSDSITFRMLESVRADFQREPAVSEQVLCLSPAYGNEIPAADFRDFANRTSHELAIASSTALLGFLHQVLYSFARLGNVQGTLRTFYKTQAFIDAKNQELLRNSMDELTQSKLDIDDSPDTTDEIGSFTLHSQLPVHILITLLNLAREAKLFDFGKWILYKDDVNRPAIPPELYAETDLQPCLLNFAAATADTNLQARVTEKLQVPLQPAVLRSLMHSHMDLGNWSSVEKIFGYIRNTEEHWNPTDVMKIANHVLRMEKDSSNETHVFTDQIILAITLLQTFFSGEFNTPRNPSARFDFCQVRTMNQLFRILKRCPGELSKLTSPYSHRSGRTTESINIPVQAFNVLVDGIVESKGSSAGKELWDTWCLKLHGDDSANPENPSSAQTLDEETPKVVRPNLQTLQTILRPTIQAAIDMKNMREQKSQDQATVERRVLPVVDYEILAWGRKMLIQFGLSEEEIAVEIPEFLAEPPQAKLIDRMNAIWNG